MEHIGIYHQLQPYSSYNKNNIKSAHKIYNPNNV